MIFSRRAIQRRLDELRDPLGAETVGKLADRLNRPGKDRMAAMWEVIVLQALIPLGAIKNEAALPSGRRPDLSFIGPNVSFVADITTVSDEGLDERNPYREFSDKIEHAKKRLGLKTGGTDLRIAAQREESKRGKRTSLRLPPRKGLADFVRKEIEPRLREQLAEGREILHLAFEDERCALELTIDPSKSPYNSGSYPAYDVPTIKDQNPLYNALRSKANQLRGAGGLVGVIVGDGDSRTMADHGGGWDEVGARAIADEFLRQNSSIGFVLLLSVREQRKEWFNVDPPVRQLHAMLAVSKTQAVPGDLEPLFRRMMESMPIPVAMPVNAAQHARKTGYGLGHHGGIRLSGNRIRISAREVMEILAGRLTVEEANSWRGWDQTDGDARTGASQNPFERWLTQGRLPSSITVLKCGEGHDDDWLEIEVGEPDPAITRFS